MIGEMAGGGFETYMLAAMISNDKQSVTTADAVNYTAQVTTYGAAATSVAVAHLSLPEWAAIVSMTVAVLGFIIQLALAIRTFVRDAREAKIDREAARAEREEQRAERVLTRQGRDDGGP